MAEKRKGKQTEERAVKPWFAWMLRHELLSSCGLTLALGVAIGGVCTLLEQFLA